jgi:hypothetical protein
MSQTLHESGRSVYRPAFALVSASPFRFRRARSIWSSLLRRRDQARTCPRAARLPERLFWALSRPCRAGPARPALMQDLPSGQRSMPLGPILPRGSRPTPVHRVHRLTLAGLSEIDDSAYPPTFRAPPRVTGADERSPEPPHIRQSPREASSQIAMAQLDGDAACFASCGIVEQIGYTHASTYAEPTTHEYAPQRPFRARPRWRVACNARFWPSA